MYNTQKETEIPAYMTKLGRARGKCNSQEQEVAPGRMLHRKRGSTIPQTSAVPVTTGNLILKPLGTSMLTEYLPGRRSYSS